MRVRKFLLVTKALTTAGLLAACKKEDLPPPPGNPKGMWADERDRRAAEAGAGDAGTSDDAGTPVTEGPHPPKLYPPPGNPKGSHYTPPPTARDAGPIPPPANPKGSQYDKGIKKPSVDDSH